MVAHPVGPGHAGAHPGTVFRGRRRFPAGAADGPEGGAVHSGGCGPVRSGGLSHSGGQRNALRVSVGDGGLSRGKAPPASDSGGSHPHADLLRSAHRRVSLGGAGLRDAELSDGGAPVPPGERPTNSFDGGAVPDLTGQPLRGEVRQPAAVLWSGGGAAVAVSQALPGAGRREKAWQAFYLYNC